LITQVSAKTANHDLKALKMLFKSARRDGVVTEDPTEFVETARRERRPKIKRPFTLPELRSVLDLASDEWRSMIIFRLYSGQRLGVNAVEGCIFACGKCIPDVLCLSV
jgi:integrase